MSMYQIWYFRLLYIKCQIAICKTSNGLSGYIIFFIFYLMYAHFNALWYRIYKWWMQKIDLNMCESYWHSTVKCVCENGLNDLAVNYVGNFASPCRTGWMLIVAHTTWFVINRVNNFEILFLVNSFRKNWSGIYGTLCLNVPDCIVTGVHCEYMRF